MCLISGAHVAQRLSHLEVEPLAVPVGVEVGPEVELVVGLGDPDGLGQVPGLEAGFESKRVGKERLMLEKATDRSLSWPLAHMRFHHVALRLPNLT